MFGKYSPESVREELVKVFKKLLSLDYNSGREGDLYSFFTEHAHVNEGELKDIYFAMPASITGSTEVTPLLVMGKEEESLKDKLEEIIFSEDFLNSFSEHLGSRKDYPNEEKFVEKGLEIFNRKFDELVA